MSTIRKRVFVNVPRNESAYITIQKMAFWLDFEIVVDPSIADLIFEHLHTPKVETLEAANRVIVGDFSKPQTVPSDAILLDKKTGRVISAGTNFCFKYWIKEFCPIPLPA